MLNETEKAALKAALRNVVRLGRMVMLCELLLLLFSVYRYTRAMDRRYKNAGLYRRRNLHARLSAHARFSWSVPRRSLSTRANMARPHLTPLMQGFRSLCLKTKPRLYSSISTRWVASVGNAMGRHFAHSAIRVIVAHWSHRWRALWASTSHAQDVELAHSSGHTNRCPITHLDPNTMSQYDYAVYVLTHNPIRKDETLAYRGLTDRKPHGITQHIWKLAFLWVDQCGLISYKPNTA